MGFRLPILDAADPCRDCGACCRGVVMPPFIADFFIPELANEEFTAFKSRWPGLAAELKAEYERKIREDDRTDFAPCFWYDAATGRCRNYEARPEICRDFEPQSVGCLLHREREGIDRPLPPALR